MRRTKRETKPVQLVIPGWASSPCGSVVVGGIGRRNTVEVRRSAPVDHSFSAFADLADFSIPPGERATRAGPRKWKIWKICQRRSFHRGDAETRRGAEELIVKQH